MSGRLDGKVCLITGAGSGMGRLAAIRFGQEGAKVIACDVNLDAVKETAQMAEAAGGRALAVKADVSKEADVKEAVKAGVKAFGKLDVLYNNAGIFPSADNSVVNTEEKVWDQVLAVNVKGVYLVCKHGIPELLAAGGGSVINVASFVALVGCSVPQDAYTASKGAVIALTKSLAVQFGPKGIRSNAICPGPIETPLLMQLLSDEQKRQRRFVHIPMGRLGRAEELAKAALFLASDDSSFMTGASLIVDGGITAAYVTPED